MNRGVERGICRTGPTPAAACRRKSPKQKKKSTGRPTPTRELIANQASELWRGRRRWRSWVGGGGETKDNARKKKKNPNKDQGGGGERAAEK
jgi:hypothetical protein